MCSPDEDLGPVEPIAIAELCVVQKCETRGTSLSSPERVALGKHDAEALSICSDLDDDSVDDHAMFAEHDVEAPSFFSAPGGDSGHAGPRASAEFDVAQISTTSAMLSSAGAPNWDVGVAIGHALQRMVSDAAVDVDARVSSGRAVHSVESDAAVDVGAGVAIGHAAQSVVSDAAVDVDAGVAIGHAVH